MVHVFEPPGKAAGGRTNRGAGTPPVDRCRYRPGGRARSRQGSSAQSRGSNGGNPKCRTEFNSPIWADHRSQQAAGNQPGIGRHNCSQHRGDLTGDSETTVYRVARRLFNSGADPQSTVETWRSGKLSMAGKMGKLATLKVASSQDDKRSPSKMGRRPFAAPYGRPGRPRIIFRYNLA